MSFEVNAIVEIPYGDSYKYEVDKETGKLKLDRPLNQPCPANYGYLPFTLELDGDPLDIFVMSHSSIYPLTEVKVTIVGGYLCTDAGLEDNKILGILAGESFSKGILTGIKSDIKRYLSTYKDGFVVGEFVEADEAYKLLMKATQAYQDNEG